MSVKRCPSYRGDRLIDVHLIEVSVKRELTAVSLNVFVGHA